MPVPIVYRSGGDANVSYDWTDFTTGFGYKRFYGAGRNLGLSVAHMLTNTIIDSGSGTGGSKSGIRTVAASAGATLDIDFDITLTKPMYVAGGNCFVNFTTVYGTNPNVTPTVNIIHVDGSDTETNIGTLEGTSAGVDSTKIRLLFKIPLTAKQFGRGEKIRVNIILIDNNATQQSTLYHDPSSGLTFTDPVGRTIGTDLTVDIPFKIDI